MIRRKITHRDVAEKAGVSATTVSFVLNGRTEAYNISEETEQRVMDAARSLGYMPSAAAQALRFGRSQNIGIILKDSNIAFEGYVITDILNGVLTVTQQNNQRLLIHKLTENDIKTSYLELAQAKSIDGLIIPEPGLTDTAIQFLSDYNFPVVVLGHLQGSNFSSIDFDNQGGARAVVEHLLSLGHTRIACITLSPFQFNTFAKERVQGYKDALVGAGISINEELIFYSEGNYQSSFETMMRILESGLAPTAVFCLNDIMAAGAMTAIEERGLNIPDQIAVAGFDDSPYTLFIKPSLTSVKLHFEELGRMAGEMLLDLINEQTTPGTHIKIPTHLVVRKSTDPKYDKH